MDAVENKKLLEGGEIVVEGFQGEMAEKEAWFLVPQADKALVHLWKAIDGHRHSCVSRVRFFRLVVQEVARGKIVSDGGRSKFFAGFTREISLRKEIQK